jgi:hypothetical protein
MEETISTDTIIGDYSVVSKIGEGTLLGHYEIISRIGAGGMGDRLRLAEIPN